MQTTPTGTLGGRDFAISSRSGPSIRLTWTDGTLEDNYQLLRLLPSPPIVTDLPGTASSYTDTAVTTGGIYCYILIPRIGTAAQGNTDLLCDLPH